MKVLFDHQKFSMQRYGGISRYFANLNEGLNNRPGYNSAISLLYSENEYIKTIPFPFNNRIGDMLFSGHNSRIYRWNRRYTKLYVKLNSFDIFHPTYYDPYFISFIRKPFVVTVHDMVHETLPHIFQDADKVSARKKILITKADRIIAISEHTKNDILIFYPQFEDKISVVHHGYAIRETGISNLDLPKEYILFVGERWHYKNFIKSLNAISPLFIQNRNLNLMCAGGGAFSELEISLFDRLGISSQCQQMNVDDAGLNQMYKQAKLLFFPSLQEGFGLPLLEAFNNNCPVVCSNRTSLPEIGGNAVYYIDPDDDVDINNAVEKVLYDKNLQLELKQAGQKRLSQFTFDNCLKDTIKVYQSLI